jgi:hypothetical protein
VPADPESKGGWRRPCGWSSGTWSHPGQTSEGREAYQSLPSWEQACAMSGGLVNQRPHHQQR